MGACIVWTGRTSQDGYGQFDVGDTGWMAHRWIYSVAVAPIPDGLYVIHSCDNPSCVTLQHLTIGTQLHNMRDAINKGRMAWQKKG